MHLSEEEGTGDGIARWGESALAQSRSDVDSRRRISGAEPRGPGSWWRNDALVTAARSRTARRAAKGFPTTREAALIS